MFSKAAATLSLSANCLFTVEEADVSNSVNVAKCNLGQVKCETMLASGCSLGFGAGWPGALCRGRSMVYSSASDVKSFCVCF